MEAGNDTKRLFEGVSRIRPDQSIAEVLYNPGGPM